jgi:deoxyadenosine/deoxycytidine kinase
MAVKIISKKSSSLKSKPVKASALKSALSKSSPDKSSLLKAPVKKIISVTPAITKKSVTPLHIAVAGNIGAGKTTLTTLLAKNMKWEPHFEDVDDNPYLNDFYEDMQRWSFNLQIYFLNSRFQQVMKIRQNPKTVIQDRTIYEDAYIFAPNLHAMGLMTTRDFNNYQALFNLMSKFISPPDLLIYLRGTVPALVSQIQKRGRDYENSIRIDYLKRLNERYEAWISTYELGKLLVIDIDDINFAENPEHLGVIINKINAEIHGLF